MSNVQDDIRSMNDPNDEKYLASWRVGGGTLVLTIAKVVPEIVEDKRKGTKQRRPIMYFKEPDFKPMVLNKTNQKVLSTLYGNYVSKWAGKRVGIYSTPVSVGGETKDGLRIRTQAPEESKS